MAIFRNTSIQGKQTLIIMLASGVALSMACIAFVVNEAFSFRQALVQDVSVLAEVIGDNSREALRVGDGAVATETLGALRAYRNVSAAAVFDREGAVFARYMRDDDSSDFRAIRHPEPGHAFLGTHLELYHEVENEGERLGAVLIKADPSPLSERIGTYVGTSAGVFAACLLLAFVVSRPLRRFLSEPILDLVATTRQVTANADYSIRVPRRSDDELGELADAFNEMLRRIEAHEAEVLAARQELESRVEERTAALEEAKNEAAREQARLKFIFDSVPMGIALRTVRPDGSSNELVNNVQWRICGINPEGKAPEHFFELTHPEDRSKQDDLHKSLERGEIDRYALEKRYLRPDGETVWVYFAVQRRRDPDGGYEDLSTAVDITELKEAQEIAMRERERLKFIFDSVPVGISLTRMNAEGEMTRMLNAAHWNICGLSPDEETDQHTFRNMTHPDDIPEQWRLFRQMEDGLTDCFSLEKRYIRPDGKRVWVSFSVQRRPDSAGGYEDLTTLVDITELKEAQEQSARDRDLLRVLLDHSHDYIYFKDLESRFIKTSKFHARSFGLETAEEAEGRTDFDFFSERHATEAFEDEQRIIRTGEPVLNKLERESWKNRSGDFWVLTSKLPLRDNEANIIGTFGISRDITAMKEAEAKLEEVHKQLLETSRQAGMAEIATSVLHNVGNVLNTVNVSASLVSDRVRQSRVTSLEKLAALLREHSEDLGDFLTNDPKGKQVPAFLEQLAEHLKGDRDATLAEVDSLQKNIEHIKEIVATQQSYARVSGVTEPVDLGDLIEDSLRMDGDSLSRHGVEVVREFEETPQVTLERHKVLQILVNLIRNAKHACNDADRPDKCITLRLANGGDTVRIEVADNGVGITEENLTRIFSHGFSTRADGHGFGLHSSALVAKEMGGSLNVHSPGPQQGATFTLTLPLEPS